VAVAISLLSCYTTFYQEVLKQDTARCLMHDNIIRVISKVMVGKNMLAFTIMIMLALITMHTTMFLSIASAQLFGDSKIPSRGQFSAQSIYTTNSIQTDPDVTNLVILIPDQTVINRPFMPQDATIVEGTTVIWVNGQMNTVHGIAVQDEGGEEIFSNATIPYKNGTSFTFEEDGTYSYSDSQNPLAHGTINVIGQDETQDILETNSTTPTVGVFAAPAEEDDYFQKHLNTLGFTIKSSYEFKKEGMRGGGGDDEDDNDEDNNERIFYIYTQARDKYGTVVYRVDTKVNALETHLTAH
jgi:plastocyanin